MHFNKGKRLISETEAIFQSDDPQKMMDIQYPEVPSELSYEDISFQLNKPLMFEELQQSIDTQQNNDEVKDKENLINKLGKVTFAGLMLWGFVSYSGVVDANLMENFKKFGG